jgi:hypothetical protein
VRVSAVEFDSQVSACHTQGWELIACKVCFKIEEGFCLASSLFFVVHTLLQEFGRKNSYEYMMSSQRN